MTSRYIKRSILLLALAFASGTAAADQSLREQLSSALLGTDSMEIVRKIAVLPNKQLKNEGITVKNNKEGGYDEVIVIHLSPPLSLYGATTNSITLAFETPYENFNGLVFATFKGAIKPFVDSAKLKKGKPKNTTSVGIYNRPLSTEPGCPTTLGATPVDSKHFVFGAGWCNG